jgi:hypothetical protein
MPSPLPPSSPRALVVPTILPTLPTSGLPQVSTAGAGPDMPVQPNDSNYARIRDANMRHQILVRGVKDQAKKTVDDWLNQVNFHDPEVLADTRLLPEYAALAQKIKHAIDAGDRTLTLDKNLVSHLPDAALTMFDTFKLKAMSRLTNLRIPSATHPTQPTHPPRHVEITNSAKLTEVAVEHRQHGLISAALSQSYLGDVSPLSELLAGELHIGIQQCYLLRKLDLCGTSATELSLQSSAHHVVLVPPPDLRNLRGRIGLGVDPGHNILAHTLCNQAHHLASTSDISTRNLTPSHPSAAAQILCLGEVTFLLQLLDHNTNFSAELEGPSPISPTLCQQQAVMRGLFGPAMRQCFGDEWVDGPGIESAECLQVDDNPVVETTAEEIAISAHTKLSEFMGVSANAANAGTSRAAYLDQLLAFLDQWPPVRQYIKNHSGLQHQVDTAAQALAIRTLQYGNRKIATSETNQYREVRKQWMRTQLHAGYSILPETPPPEFVSCTQINQGMNSQVIRRICSRQSSPYNAQTLVHATAEVGGVGLVTRITPRVALADPGAATPSIAEYDISTEHAPHMAIDGSAASPALFSLPPNTTEFKIYCSETGAMGEFQVQQ